MMHIDPTQQKERDNYKLMIGSIIPRPIAFITSQSEEGVVNAAPFSYFNIVTSNPPMISVSIQRKDGVQKDTARNILQGESFVVHIVSKSFVEEMNKTAAVLPPNESEIDLTTLTLEDSKVVPVPTIKEAKVAMECVLEHHVTLGKDNQAVDHIIGKIVNFNIDDTLVDNFRIDAQQLEPISRLAGQNYSELGRIFELERPQ
ncbi:flavin reductase family protein [Macrococcoides canis]|uniref:Flavin reductase family protein n=1 Tax=Macrococcoides canis TaxID=1855823 RepID=A0AAE7BZ78_9STAP|nr:flavin reductase family protein [Macrococcus canis]QCT75833.1 flavin reductase family protein [Macrococcus canis]QIH77200.1 flavin reductase family protein [Macrococcus canis]